jgi:autotransporter-associated beta strand protein
MKTPKNLTPTKRFRSPQFKILALAALSTLPAATGMAQTLWQGGTSDYNVPASWNGTYMDTSGDSAPNPNCSNDSGSNNVVLIQPGDVAWYHGDNLAGNGANTSGAYLQTGSTNNTGYPSNGNWMRLGIGTGSAGYYTLSNGVVNVAGETHMGELGTGTLQVAGGVFNTGYNGNPGICAGDGDFGVSSGTLILTGGTINNVNNETWFGEANSACTGYLIMSGGTFNANDWFVFGRNGAVGYGTMTGGTINFTGSGYFLIGGGGVGALAQSGGTINAYDQYLVPQSNGSGSGVGTNIVSGTAVLNVYSWLAVGRDSGYGELDISGNAAVTHNDTGSHIDVGASAVGIVNQNGGAVTNLGAPVWLGEAGTGTWNLNSGIANLGAVVMCEDGSATATLNVNGGLLQSSGINSTTIGFSTINFNGGTLQASAANASFLSGITFAQLAAGGVVIDSQSYNITIPQALSDNGGGNLTKIGLGTLTLTGGNSYSGATLVNAGTLAVTTAGSTSSSGYTVAPGAAFSVQVASAGGQFSAPAVTFANGASTLDVDLNTFGLPSSAPLSAGALTVNGTVTLNILAEAPVGLGTVPLVQYSSTTGSGSFVLGSLPPGETGYLSNAGGLVSLVITSAGAPRWNGNINGVWDISTTANWIDLISGNPTTYHNGEPVLFDDTATGTTNVTLNVTVSPGSITFNNSLLAYTLTGAGVISGLTGLTKEGTNTLALLNNGGNTYTGPTVIEGGILSVTNLANGGSPSAIGASPANATNLVLDGGTLSYMGPAVSVNRGFDIETNSVVNAEDNLAFGGTVITVPGASFAKTGPAQLTYSGAAINGLSGSQGYNVLAGTVLLAGSGAGQTNTVAGSLLINSTNGVAAAVVVTNAILNVDGGITNGQSMGAGALVINSGGVINGSGTIDLGDTINGGIASTGTVTQTGGTVNSSGQLWVGEGSSSVGTYNLSAGTLTMANWLAIGRANGMGTFNLSGTGVINDIGGGGGNLDIGTSAGINGDTGTGILNQTGGAITNTASQTWLGEGASGEPASGTWNMSGGTALLGGMYIGYGGDGTSAVNASGAGAITCTSFLDVAPAAAATGNLNVGSASQPGGSVTVEGDMTLGDLGIGLVNMVTNGGGTLTVEGTLYLSRNSETADGTVNLNAGSTIVTAYLNNGWGFHNNFSSPLDNPNAFNFNGGTLKAYVGSPYFIQPYVNAVVQGGGAVINDNGYAITVLAPLVTGGGGGGLTKVGSGTLYLTGANTYTGLTTVSAGAFGNSGTIAGPVTVNSGATLLGDTGTIGTSSINNTLTLAAGSTTVMQITPSSNDEIQGLTSVNYGGALVVTNAGGTLTSGSVYQLFHAAGAGSGTFSSVTLLPSGTATFSPATGLLTIGAVAAPTLSQPVYSGGNLILTGSGGPANGTYDIITTTNLAIPFSAWTTNVSGSFSASGTFSNAIPVSTSVPMQYFRLAP